MAQGVGSLDERTGYVLKQASAALRSAMENVLRPLQLTMPQYACMELLSRSPGLSGAQLARGAFVSRQSMNLVLRGLQERGLVTRPEAAPAGRTLPTELTEAGQALLGAAAIEVEQVEKRMVSALSRRQRRDLRDYLVACAAALSSSPPKPGGTGGLGRQRLA